MFSTFETAVVNVLCMTNKEVFKPLNFLYSSLLCLRALCLMTFMSSWKLLKDVAVK